MIPATSGWPGFQYVQFVDKASPVRHCQLKLPELSAPINALSLLQWYCAPLWCTVVFKAT